MGWMSITGNGDLNISACNNGSENITVMLKDSGGTEFGGQDVLSKIIVVHVVSVNDKPHFVLINDGILYILEDSKDFIPFVAMDISAGRCEEQGQQLSFTAQATSSNIFSSVGLHMNGTAADLLYSLIPNANGVETISFLLSDGNLSLRKNLTVVIVPVNDPPSFYLRDAVLVLEMDTTFSSQEFALQIHSGPIDEESQRLRFGFKLLDGPRDMVDSVHILCPDDTPLPASSNWMKCSSNGTADIEIYPGLNRFGSGIFEIYVLDNGNNIIPCKNLTVGCLSAPQPIDHAKTNLTIQIPFKNIAPLFSLSTPVIRIFENSACFSDSIPQNRAQPRCERGFSRIHRYLAFAVAISKGSVYEDSLFCPDKLWLTPQPNILFSCVNQTVTFTVTGRQGVLFDLPPRIFEDGSLMFKLAENQVNPSGSFKVFLTDNLGAVSSVKFFTFEVVAVNSAPSFSVPELVVGFQNIAFKNLIITNISAGINEPNQQITFFVEVVDEGLFNFELNAPKVSSDGTLIFSPGPNKFGTTLINITARDDGGSGSGYGGISSFSKSIRIEILEVKEAPIAFVPDIYIFENKNKVHKSSDIELKLDGSKNAMCTTNDEASASCAVQAVSFSFLDASNPLLFSKLPSFDQNNSLVLEICNECSGFSKISFEVTGSGHEGIEISLCNPCGVSKESAIHVSCCFDASVISDGWISGTPIHLGSQSSSLSFYIFVEPVDTEPEFAMPWNVNRQDNIPYIDCLALDNENVSWHDGKVHNSNQDQQECVPWDQSGMIYSTITLIENSGWFEIGSFASSISPAKEYSGTSVALFSYDTESKHISFNARRRDQIFGIRGMEFATAVTYNPDKTIAMVVEIETSILAYWDVVPGSKTLAFKDARSDGELRLRFGGWTTGLDDSVSVGTDPRIVETVQVCALDLASLNGDKNIFVASGCELLNHSDAYLLNDTFKSDPLWKYVVGHWDFTSAAMYTTSRPMKSSFIGHQDLLESVTCDNSYCRYRRARNVRSNCAPLDEYSTDIGPATFRDESEKMGAAVMLGIPCTLGALSTECCKAGTDWDVPKESGLSSTNFLVSAGRDEAIQFDSFDSVSAVTRGLYVAYSMERLVDGNPSTSILPLQQLSIEAWFTAGDVQTSNLLFPLVSTLQQASNCQKGWALSWFVASGRLSLYFDISLDMALGCRSQAACKTSSCSLMKSRCAQYGDGVGAKSVFVIPTASRPLVQQGEWFHAVATYDGRKVNLYLNNEILLSTQACDGQSYCGVYASTYHTCPQYCTCPSACPDGNCPCGGENQTLGGLSVCSAKSPVTIGVIDSSAATQGNAGKHRGLLKLLRVYNTALDGAAVASQFADLQHLLSLRDSPTTYWAQSTGEMSLNYPLYQDIPPPRSPDINFVNIMSLRSQISFNIFGQFDTSLLYKARFESNSVVKGTLIYSEEGSCNSSLTYQYSRILTCFFPSQWRLGYKSSVLSILELPKSATIWRTIWSRACFHISCGYEAILQRKTQVLKPPLWFVNPPNSTGYSYSTISKGVSGSLTFIWFVVYNDIYKVVNSNGSQGPLSVIGHLGARTGSGFFGNLKTPFTQNSGWQYPVQGSASIKVIRIDSIDYMFAANFWNGYTREILSSIFRIDYDINGKMQITYIQGVPTSGARDWIYFKHEGANTKYVAVANFVGSSYLYRWLGPQHVDTVEVVDPGSGYIPGDIVFGSTDSVNRSSVVNAANQVRAKFTVDGNKGGIHMWVRSNLTRGCALKAFTRMFSKPNMTSNCSVGTLIAGTRSAKGMIGNVTDVDHDGSIIEILVISGARIFNFSERPGIELFDQQSSCLCNGHAGDWTECIDLHDSPIDLRLVIEDDQGSGFLGNVSAVQNDGRIQNISVISQGRGYSQNINISVFEDADVQFSTKNTCECFAEDTLDWHACIDYSQTLGAISEISIIDEGAAYFADLDFRIFYEGTQINMASTITNIWIKPTLSKGCALNVYSGIFAKPNLTSNCTVGTVLIGTKNANGLVANVTGVDSFGQITQIALLQGAKQIGGEAEIVLSKPSSCLCLAVGGRWMNCLILETSPIEIFVKVLDDATGFKGRVTEVDGEGSIKDILIEEHGRGFSAQMMDTLRFVVTEQSEYTQFQQSESHKCQCTGMSWVDCIGISVAEGSSMCRGGYQAGSRCITDSSCHSSCSDHCSPNEMGQCIHSAGAVLRASPIQDLPSFVKSQLFSEQGDWWTGAPGLSSTVPIDIMSRMEIPGCHGASAIASFNDQKKNVYLACAIYHNPSPNNPPPPSIVYQIQALEDRKHALIEPYQYINTNAAHDVDAWSMDYGKAGTTVFVAFACEMGSSSPVLRWSVNNQNLEHVQDIQTSGAVSLKIFMFENTPYLLIGQSGQESLVLRWNGTQFLCLNTIETLPKDTAGGQIFQSDNAQAMIIYETEDYSNYLFVGNYNNMSFTYKARTENISGLHNPSCAVFTSDAKFLYVASYGSRSIAAFDVESNGSRELIYNRANSLHSTTAVSFAGLYAIGIFAGKNVTENQTVRSFLYAASLIDKGGMINVFHINTNGSLLEQPHLRTGSLFTGGRSLGLYGVRSLLISQEYLFAASIFDQAVSTFRIDPFTGKLDYIDHICNGERLITKYSAQLSSWINSNKTAGEIYPWRNFYLNKSIVSIKSFDMMNRSMLAVTSARKETKYFGEALLFEFMNGSLVLIQLLESGSSPSDMEYVQISRNDSITAHYLLVASEIDPTNVYKWDTHNQRFAFDSSLSNNAGSYRGTKYLVSALVEKVAIVVIGAWCSSCPPNSRNSSIYRWQESEKKFLIFQVLPIAAIDVSIAVWPSTVGTSTTLLALANYGQSSSPGFCALFEYSSTAPNRITGQLGAFIPLLQNATISGLGVTAVAFFRIPSSGYYLAVASRQKNTSIPEGYSSQGTRIFQWQPKQRVFTLFQSLDHVKSIPIGNKAWSGSGRDTLIGPTHLKPFFVDNETYLAISQSLCGWSIAFGECQSYEEDEPQSAVLQWISVPWPGRFDELQSITNSINQNMRGAPLNEFDSTHHSQQFRVPFSRAGRIEFVSFKGIQHIMFSSFTNGLILFEWKFEQVVGLQRISALAAVTNSSILTASEAEGALAVFQLKEEAVAGSSNKNRSNQSLEFVTSWQDRTDGYVSTKLGSYRSLKGVRSIEVADDCGPYSSPAWFDKCVTAHTQAPRNERICTDVDPLWPPWVNPLQSEIGPLPCQSLTFHVVEIHNTVAADELFQASPRISQKGALSFEIAENQFGTALLQIELVDDGASASWSAYSSLFSYDTTRILNPMVGHNTSKVSYILINIIPLNESIWFLPVPVVANHGDNIFSLFATNISVVLNQKVVFLWNWIWLQAKNMQCQEGTALMGIYTFGECKNACSLNELCIYFSFSQISLEVSVPCFISYDSCTLIPARADTYQTPRYYFETSPILVQSDEGISGLINVLPKSSTFGNFQMNVTALDIRKKNLYFDNQDALLAMLVEINIPSKNKAPTANMSNLSVYVDSGEFIFTSWIRDVSAGSGECSCLDVMCTYGVWPDSLPCQNLTFSLIQVHAYPPNGMSPIALFSTFDVDISSGNMSFALKSNVSGSFVLIFSLTDDGDNVIGGSDVGGQNMSLFTAFLTINVKQKYTGLVELVVPEESNLTLQQHQYFEIQPSLLHDSEGGSKRARHQITFRVLDSVCADYAGNTTDCDKLFFYVPVLSYDGTVSFILQPQVYGRAALNVSVVISGPGYSDQSLYSMVIKIFNVNAPPVCQFPDFISVIESLRPQVISQFAINVSAGPANENMQKILFSISVKEAEGQMFVSSPIIDSQGSLHFQLNEGRFGVSTMLIVCFDDGGTVFGGSDHSGLHQVQVRVLAAPQIYSINPGLISTNDLGSIPITIFGKHFGSIISRGYYSEIYSQIDVLIGNSKCIVSVFVTDEELVCNGPPSSYGLFDVSVLVMDPSGWLPGTPPAEFSRSASYPRALASGQLFAVGFNPVSRESALYIGFTNNISDAADEVQLMLHRMDAILETSGMIRKVLKMAEMTFIAGSFKPLQGQNQLPASNIALVSKILSADRKSIALLPLGNGLNGAVRSMIAFRGNLVVGGSFTRAHNSDSQPVINCGGLAFWNVTTKQWSKVGSSTVNGAIHEILAISDQFLIVAGFFSHVDGILANNIALHRGGLEEIGTWESMGGGVSGGYITCLAAKGNALYAGGTFISVETGSLRKPAKYLALWDGFRWDKVEDLNCLEQCSQLNVKGECAQHNCGVDGFVLALAVVDEVLFVSGNFRNVGSLYVGSVARYFEGHWSGLVGTGLQNGAKPATIYVMDVITLSINHGQSSEDTGTAPPCLLLGGDFQAIGNKSIKNLAYLCNQSWNVSYSLDMLGEDKTPDWKGFDTDLDDSIILATALEI
eukprot:CAMPEP_0172151100 /NCGR_PEP_ID=MMETSP1050-20130122/33_1 /TAXON_ID=233186 /ORGANISM="Cryptomonas curvata, Strain CCAP979/52" /LENGTH=4383 /DNA_ID=CAMNT_0012819151 /DNA_START=1220 /DNA_END=14372 /DNA_ORIENTATION=-